MKLIPWAVCGWCREAFPVDNAKVRVRHEKALAEHAPILCDACVEMVEASFDLLANGDVRH